MKVVNANDKTFNEFYTNIKNKLLTDKKWFGEEVLIIGIASAGIDLAKGIESVLNNEGMTTTTRFIKCQRPSTKEKKESKFKAVIACFLKKSPFLITDFLRILEHKYLSQKREKTRHISIMGGHSINGFKKIIIVDDAIDSGHSFIQVLNFLKESNNNADFFTCSYVMTQRNPVFSPDYFFLQDVLVRFPWSLDYKE